MPVIVPLLVLAATDKAPEPIQENPEPTIGAHQSNRPGFQNSRSPYDRDGNYHVQWERER
jgi:hypothetical protein